MCLILFAHRARSDYPLVLAANRDESYARPAAPADFWSDYPAVYGGRDLEAGGTWLGLTRTGRIAAVTNYREPQTSTSPGTPLSRGALAVNYLTGGESVEPYLEKVRRDAARYRGFILIAGDLNALYWYSNRGPDIQRVSPGVHGLSNHLLDTPWPKIVRSKEALTHLLAAGEAELVSGLFDILSDRSESPDPDLPDTGVGMARERKLSATFISDQRYGTRASTVLLIDAHGVARFIERSYGVAGTPLGQTDTCFRLGSGSANASAVETPPPSA